MKENTHEIIAEYIKSAQKVILGKELEIKLSLCCFLSGGHLLIEDVPGVGKTTFAKTMAKLLDLSFSRIQFTNDLMPSDIVGVNIFEPKENAFKFIPGPIFHQFVLADELNRGTPKTQSALLEAMEEHQVSLDGVSLKLPEPFFVIATQNPRSQIGTHHLPESQIDRFMMKMKIGYPNAKFEMSLIGSDQHLVELQSLKPAFTLESITHFSKKINEVAVSPELLNYVIRLLETSRNHDSFQGLSPRAGRDIIKMSKAWAFLQKREYVLPDDVQTILPYIISHRLSPYQGQGVDQDVELSHELIKKTHVD
jgi:MoxR-like ATPase